MQFYLASIYVISIMLCQGLAGKLFSKISNDFKKYPNLFKSARTLNRLAYVPLFNTFYFVSIFYYCVKNKCF